MRGFRTSNWKQNAKIPPESSPQSKPSEQWEKIKNKKKKWGSGLGKTVQGPFIELSELVGQWLHGYQYGTLRIIYMNSLCDFSVTLMSPQNILGIHNPNEIIFVKGRQPAKILAPENVMEKVFGICRGEESGSSTFIWQQQDGQFECPKESVRHLYKCQWVQPEYTKG